ncbi:MAG: polymerase [Bacteroidota bacterium]
MSSGKLFLLDGMALIYRAFFAFSQNPRITSKGLNASAMFGFTNTLLDILNKQKPTHIAVVFDTAAPTHRHKEFEAYKAHREEMPEDLAKSIPYIFKIIEGFNIPVITMDGYEADDIIGTLAWKAGDVGLDVFMMTPDKDFGQLVRDNVKIYKPGRMGSPDEILGVEEVLKKWEITEIKQVVDILGLWGDASDNIPGVPGVGEKTAKKLIAEYGSIENILENTDKLKGKMQENMIAFAEQAKVSKWLATIDTQVPVELDLVSLQLDPVNAEKLTEVFEELEFRTLAKRVLGASATSVASEEDGVSRPKSVKKALPSNPLQGSLFDSPSSASSSESVGETNEEIDLEGEGSLVPKLTIVDVPHEYKTAITVDDRRQLILELEAAEYFCFDTETTNVESLQAEIVGLSFSTKPHTAWYVPIPADKDEAALILQEFAGVLSSSKLKIAQNIKYDVAVLRNYGIVVANPWFDTLLAHYLLEPDKRHNMQVLSEDYLNYSPISIETLIGKKGKNQGNMRDVSVELIAEYAAEDADITLQLYLVFKDLIDQQGVKELFETVEIPLVHVLEDMERNGIALDVDFLKQYSSELLTQMQLVQQRIFESAGFEFNISSPQQVGKVLFEQLQLLDKPKKTKTGQYQTDEETLLSLVGKHTIVQDILDFRALQKLKSTYVDALPELVDKESGRVHTHFNQAVAATGRLSSQNPNLQNIPIRTELGREIRKAFIAGDSGKVLLSADYSQIELRIIAHISSDPGMKEAFQLGYDIHTATAAKVWGVNIDEVDKEMRRKAKTVNFGIIYGISAFGLSQRVGISRGEAKEIIDNYFREFGGVRDYMDEAVRKAQENGYVETILGRRRYIRDIHSRNAVMRGFAERNAINAPIQGSAADMIKVAMIKIHDWLTAEKLSTRMLLQVHDELVFDVPKEELAIVQSNICNLMETAMPLSVPVLVESGIGGNWLEAH